MPDYHMKDMYIVNPSIATERICCGDLRSYILKYGRDNIQILLLSHDKRNGDTQYRIYRRDGKNWLPCSTCSCLKFSHLIPAINANRTSIFTDNNFTKKLYAGGA